MRDRPIKQKKTALKKSSDKRSVQGQNIADIGGQEQNAAKRRERKKAQRRGEKNTKKGREGKVPA